MATAPARTGWFKARSTHRPATARALTAAAAGLDLSDRVAARRQRALRQAWQSDAWGYRDSIGELNYAVRFLSNCAARMRIFPGAYPEGADPETDKPVTLKDIPGAPQSFIDACTQAMRELGNGRLAISAMLAKLSTNTSVAGESYMLGRQDPETGRDTWSVRSVSEIVITEDQYRLREVPSDPNGVTPWIDLNPDNTVLSRMWVPHPEWQAIADSPLRAMLDDCESLMILRRGIRSTGRSRLARNGILAIPEEFEIATANDDDPDAQDFFGEFADSMMAPINDEGVASAAVPIFIRGPGEHISKIQYFDLAPAFDERSALIRAELISIIATTFDLPKEVIVGVADLNHWSAWQVDDSTFRHHVEPHVITICDCLTGAFLRPWLLANGQPDEWVERAVLWYDPTELVTHPDRTADAKDAYGAMVIGAKTYRDSAGFTDADAPTSAELEARRLWDIRALPLNLLMEYARRADPTLIVPPINVAGTVPGIKLGGVDLGEPPPTAGGPPAPPSDGTPPVGTPPAAAPAPPGPPTPKPPAGQPPAITAAGTVRQDRLSHKLAAIDRDLRARLQTAANAAMHRQLERVGNRMRSKVAKDETLRTKIAHRSNERVTAVLGRDVVTAGGVNVNELLGSDWEALHGQFNEWTAAAQEQAIAVALRMGALEQTSAAVSDAQTAMAAGRDAGWDVLSRALTGLGHHLLYDPDPNTDAGDWAGLNPDTLVPTGMIRAALAVAGGAPLNAVTVSDTGAVDASGYLGQVGTGQTIGGLLSSAGGTQADYEWEHGPSLNAFEPHEALDGVQFSDFDDAVLANPDSFPANQYLFPGDHQGCLCDVTPLWDFPGLTTTDSEES